jgi:diguanylate cyclase (GGDEF)-like protein/PAS domain S-box-containing protein
MVSQLQGNEDRKGKSRPIDYPDIVSASGDLSTVVDLAGRYLYCSAASQDMFGWRPNELIGMCEDDLVHPDDVSTLRASRSARTLLKPVTVCYRYRCKDGSYRWVEATSRHATKRGPEVVVNTVRDITERQMQTASLELRATTDPLTGVANRTVLMDRLHQGLRRLGRSQGMLAVLYLDLDHFKVINDSLGHRIGDDVLLKIAERLTHHLRPADTLARLGGDEFVLVAEGVTDEAAAITLANRIIEDGRRPFRLDGDEFSCTMSIGVACTADSQRNGVELLSEADLALYRAKDKGRDRVAVFDEELRTTAVERMVTERMLRRALDEDRIVVEYQPMVDIRSGYPLGAEALVRIREPDDDLRLPGSFIGVAEETGLLIPIDEVVLADAVKQAGVWRTRLGDKFGGVAVNVTARHLADVDFRQAVVDQLKMNRVPPSDLQVEVTEQVLMEASNSAMTGLRSLRALGVKIGLDDFGMGYSSLAYLRQFPLDFVKIDKSFIDGLVTDQRDRAVVSAIIVVAHALDLTVVAEGVEHASQREVLIDLGCDRAQGFFYAASGAPENVDTLVLPEPDIQLTETAVSMEL